MVVYRSSLPDDFVDVRALFRQLWPDKQLGEDAMSQVFSRSMKSKRDFLISAEACGRIIGFGCLVVSNSFWQEASIGHITTLIVDENHRNQGIGIGLLKKLEDTARGHGCRRLEQDTVYRKCRYGLHHSHV